MAGASLNGLKARMKSVQSTMQITKAMELVATSKLRRAKERAEEVRCYARLLDTTAESLISLAAEAAVASPFLSPPSDGGDTLFIVMAGDRGLAGGYNNTVLRLARTLSADRRALFLPVGKKALEQEKRRGAPLFSDAYPSIGSLGVGDAMKMGEEICSAFAKGKLSSVYLLYTEFTSMMTQTPRVLSLLPLLPAEKEEKRPSSVLCDSEADELTDAFFPSYVGGKIYAAICESVASECGARRTAMNAANKNAAEMIDTLLLHYNRARQAVITQEITEIVSGAEAL